VAILNYDGQPDYVLASGKNLYQQAYDLLSVYSELELTVITIEDISNGGLQDYNVLVFPDNNPPIEALDVISDWINEGNGIIAFGLSVQSLCFSGIFPPEAKGSHGYLKYWGWTSWSSVPNRFRIVIDHEITKGYPVGNEYDAYESFEAYNSSKVSGSIILADVQGSLDPHWNVAIVAYEYPWGGRIVHIGPEYTFLVSSSAIDFAPLVKNAVMWAGSSPINWPMFRRDPWHSSFSISTAPNTNNTLWVTTVGGYVYSPAVSGSRVYVSITRNSVMALNESTGAVIWEATIGYVKGSSPAVAYGKVFVGASEWVGDKYFGTVYALDEKTGELKWKRLLDEQLEGGIVGSSPAIFDRKVFIVSYVQYDIYHTEWRLYALEEATGKILWNFRIDGGVKSSPAVSDGKVFLTSSERVYVLDANSGEIIWTSEKLGRLISSVSIFNGKVFVSGTSAVYALDKDTGSLIWSCNIDLGYASTPAVAYGKVFVGGGKWDGEGRVYALDENTGSLVWSYVTGGMATAGPVVANGKVFVGALNDKFYALDVHDGRLIWSYNLHAMIYVGDAITSHPAIANGKVFIGTWDGYVYAFGPTEVDFEISVSPEFQTVNPGDTVSYTITINPLTETTFDVNLSSEWIDPSPANTEIQLDPTKVTPPGTSTLTVTTASTTPLGQYSIKITGKSGSVIHSKTVKLQVGYAVEIEIDTFRIKKDFDPSSILDDDWVGAADLYFLIDVSTVDDDGDGVVDEDGDRFRSPKNGFEINVGDDELNKAFVGPIYIPKKLASLPIDYIRIIATDSDPFFDDGLTDLTIFEIDQLPFEYELLDSENIYFKVTIREIMPTRFTIDLKTNDEHNQNQWYWFEVDADLVWKDYEEISFDEIIVAVLDTGVDYNHPDLADNMWRDIDNTYGYDFVDSDNDPVDEGAYVDGTLTWHGTEMAGIIAARGNNNIGIAGIALNAKIMAVRVVPQTGWADPDNVAAAIRYAVTKGAKVISMSFPVNPNKNLESAIDFAYKKGVILVAASGNFKTSRAYYPAAYENVISVSALMRANILASKLDPTSVPKNISHLIFSDQWPATDKGSNYGPSNLNPLKSILISAPGTWIYTTAKDNRYEAPHGTSPATPIVSAVVSLILGYTQKKYPDRPLNPNEVRYILQVSALDLGPNSWDSYYGYGIVNAYNALQKVDEVLGREGWQIRLDPFDNLDLHIYDSLDHHVGLNYETGRLELEVPGVIHTGDETNGFETVFLPDIASYRVEIVGKEISESSNYTLSIWLSNQTGALIDEWNFVGEIVEGAVYAYGVKVVDEVATVMPDPVTELEHLKAFIMQLPDDVFDQSIRRASQLKKALSNKIDEVIEKVKAGNYTDAINKLLHDIRAKMDGDSTTQDWIIDTITQFRLCVIIDHIIANIKELQRVNEKQ
jgi:outer membrane protein assembly factor BamB